MKGWEIMALFVVFNGLISEIRWSVTYWNAFNGKGSIKFTNILNFGTAKWQNVYPASYIIIYSNPEYKIIKLIVSIFALWNFVIGCQGLYVWQFRYSFESWVCKQGRILALLFVSRVDSGDYFGMK